MELNEQEREYLAAVKRASLPEIAEYLRTRCPECDRKLSDLPIGDDSREDYKDEHTMIGPFILIGCEGYLIINPLALGLTKPNWLKIADQCEEMPPHAL